MHFDTNLKKYISIKLYPKTITEVFYGLETATKRRLYDFVVSPEIKGHLGDCYLNRIIIFKFNVSLARDMSFYVCHYLT